MAASDWPLWLPTTGRLRLADYWLPTSGRRQVAADDWTTTTGHLLRPNATGCLLPADFCWLPTTGRLLLATCFLLPATGCLLLTAYSWPTTPGSLGLAGI